MLAERIAHSWLLLFPVETAAKGLKIPMTKLAHKVLALVNKLTSGKVFLSFRKVDYHIIMNLSPTIESYTTTEH